MTKKEAVEKVKMMYPTANKNTVYRVIYNLYKKGEENEKIKLTQNNNELGKKKVINALDINRNNELLIIKTMISALMNYEDILMKEKDNIIEYL